MRNILPGLPVALLLVVLGLPPRSSLAAPSGSDCLIASADVPEVHKGLLKATLSEGRRALLEEASVLERRMHDVSLDDPAVKAKIAERYSPASQEGE